MRSSSILDHFNKSAWSLILVVLLAVPPVGFAQISCATASRTQAARPLPDRNTPPMPVRHPGTPAPGRALGDKAVTKAVAAQLSGSTTVFVPLSSGFSLVSIPLRTSSQTLSDLFPNLPDGSDVWTWDAVNQQFLEGFDQNLPLGQACWMYLPMPAIVQIVGDPNPSSSIPVDLQMGWNLVGVPYQSALDLSFQSVYVNQAQMAFPDAMAAGDIGNVRAMGANGTLTPLDSNSSFEPFQGYWVYSTGEYLLQLQPGGLGDPEGSFESTFLGWGLGKLASGVASGATSWGLTQLLTALNGDPVADALKQISQQLTQIEEGQQQIEQSLSNVSNQIAVSTQEIETTVGEDTLVGPVRTALAAHYDTPTPDFSLAWFQQQATPALAPTVTNAIKTQFANDVLQTWDFPVLFDNINLAIMGSGATTGVIDNFANKIILVKSPYTLTDRYRAMQNYFADLIGMQIKCGELIGEAYNQLAADPATKANYPAGNAASWYNGTFQPAIQQEYQYYAQVVDRIAASELALPVKAGDPAVSVPQQVQVILGYSDFMLLDALNEQQGLRVHILVSPDITLPATAHVSVNGTAVADATLPPSGQWHTVNGSQNYDSWSLVNNQRQMRITNSWRATRFILTAPAGTNFSVSPVFQPEPVAVNPLTTTLGIYDSTYTAAASGNVFGSVLIAARPDANIMLDPCSGGGPVTTVVGNNCGATTNPSGGGAAMNPCHKLIANYCHGDGSDSNNVWVSATMPFTFVDTAPKTATWQGHADWTSNCYHGSYRLDLYDGASVLNEAWDDNADAWQTVPNVTWTPNHTYAYRMFIQGQGAGGFEGEYWNSCSYSLNYHNTLITAQ